MTTRITPPSAVPSGLTVRPASRHRPHVVVVGGGAGGLALATRLGRKLGKKGRADITLVDAERTHVWKPLLHQLAAGSFDTHAAEVEFLAQAHRSGFRFRLGRLAGLDRHAKTIQLAASHDDEGQEITPALTLAYDTLVLAVGSLTNDFGTPGAAEHAIKLDNAPAAKRFNERLINAYLRAQSHPRGSPQSHLTVAIVGGGATGVELAAELHTAAQALTHYGFAHVRPERDLSIAIVELAPRLLSALPERLGKAALHELQKLSIDVHTSERVVEVTASSLRMSSGLEIPAQVVVWAAGVKAPGFLADLARDNQLEVNRLNQLVVTDRLHTAADPSIYALGDCAACPQPDGSWVPPRAQAAFQQAQYLGRVLERLTAAAPGGTQLAPPFVFRDRGSLVSLSGYSSVGSLMGSLSKGSFFIEGQLAKLMYWLLHKQHQLALGGWLRTLLITLSEMLDRTYRPGIKLH
jgi:NADH:ubiquinone reductase (H+-translocating)